MDYEIIVKKPTNDNAIRSVFFIYLQLSVVRMSLHSAPLQAIFTLPNPRWLTAVFCCPPCILIYLITIVSVLFSESNSSTMSSVFRKTVQRFNRVYRLSERHIAPGYEHKVKDMMDGIKKEVYGQPGLVSIEVMTEKHKPDAYFALTCWEDQQALDTWLNSDLCKQIRNNLDPVMERPVASKEFKTVAHDIFLL